MIKVYLMFNVKSRFIMYTFFLIDKVLCHVCIKSYFAECSYDIKVGKLPVKEYDLKN